MNSNRTVVVELEVGGSSTAAASAVGLSVAFASGLSLNAAVLCGGLQSAGVRREASLLLHLAAACALDVGLNVPVAVFMLAAGACPRWLCGLSAVATQLPPLLCGFLLALLAVERLVVLRGHALDARVTRWAPLAAWMVAHLLSVSTVRTITSPFPDRYMCSPSAAGVLPLLTLLVGDALPWSTLAVCVAAALRHVSAQRRRQEKQAAAAAALTRSGSVPWLSQQPSLWTAEPRPFLLAALLFASYVLLEVPQVISSHVFPFTHNVNERSPVYSGQPDTLFVWMRFLFDVATPLIVLWMHREIRDRCAVLFCCCFRSSNVMDVDGALVPKKTKPKAVKRAMSKLGNGDKYRRIAHYRTPVLFATSEGLHIRMADDRTAEVSGSFAKAKEFEMRSRHGGPKFLCEFCDVALLTTTPTSSVQTSQRLKDAPKKQLSQRAQRLERPEVKEYWSKSDEDVWTKPRKERQNRKNVRFANSVREIPRTARGVSYSAERDDR